MIMLVLGSLSEDRDNRQDQDIEPKMPECD